MPDTLPPFETGTVDDCLLPATVALGAYWKQQCASGSGLPRFDTVDLMDLYKIAHLLIIKDVINDGEDFINRYWGTELVRALGFEYTGMRVSQYEPDGMREKLFRRYRSVVECRLPESRRAKIEHLQHRRFVTYEVLHVPFASPNGEKVSQIMTAYEFNIPLEH